MYEVLLFLLELIVNSVAVAHLLLVICDKPCIFWFDIPKKIIRKRSWEELTPAALFCVLQRQRKLLTSQPLEAWWWTPHHTQRWVISPVLQQCCPVCPLHISRSMCDTWNLSPVQRSRRITCGSSTARAKSLNPTGEFVCAHTCFLYVWVSVFTLLECYAVTWASLCVFFQPISSFCTFHLCCHSRPCLGGVACSSVQRHSPLEGDQEYLLLEECESKTLPLQASLWVASHPAGTACLCVECYMCLKKNQDGSTATLKNFTAVDLHGVCKF